MHADSMLINMITMCSKNKTLPGAAGKRKTVEFDLRKLKKKP